LDPLSGYFSLGIATVNLALEQYNEALEWADRALHEFPNYPSAIRFKVVAFAQLGRIEEARDELKRLIALDPASTIARWQAAASRLHSPKIICVAIESLRKAGLPER
jgi:adenylate cyclase